jgi:CheY-like chemotaxis protein
MGDTRAFNIMIVGDNADFSYLMQRYVRRSGYRMVVVGPGEDVLALARGKKPVAIVLEADFPGAAGWDILQALKEDETTREIPVVICSWSDEEERGLQNGAAGYLRKPVLYEDFLAILKDAGVRFDV